MHGKKETQTVEIKPLTREKQVVMKSNPSEEVAKLNPHKSCQSVQRMNFAIVAFFALISRNLFRRLAREGKSPTLVEIHWAAYWIFRV